MCNSTWIKCSHGSVPGWKPLKCPQAERHMCPKVALFCIQGMFQEMLLYFPIAGVKQYWRNVLFCYSVWELMARIQETKGCIVTIKGDR